MKKILGFAILVSVVLGMLDGCDLAANVPEQDHAGKAQLMVFGAASLSETLTQLGELYMAEHPDVTVVFNFDSSGTLKTQIQEGADCDVFISAGQKQMDQLDQVQEDSWIDLLENKVVLVVPEGNPAGIRSYEDMVEGLKAGSVLMAMGNADVPVGQYGEKILTYYGLAEEELAASGVITYGSNVKEVTAQIQEGLADCGMIYQTDACVAGLTVVDTADQVMCGAVIYPAAVLRESACPRQAQEFLEFLCSDVGDRVFEAAGFTPVGA